jgi:hypothetical protein
MKFAEAHDGSGELDPTMQLEPTIVKSLFINRLDTSMLCI